MAETCIVCLCDLAAARGESPPSRALATDDKLQDGNDPCHSDRVTSPEAPTENEETIAHLLPCGHNMHNACIKPWVEKANSCPICRASFNMVELKTHIGGPVWSSYAVQDKVQIPDVDPSMVIEDDDLFDEPPGPPCMMCDTAEDDDTLLLCDGCESVCHIHCAGLEEVPRGPWYCEHCLLDEHVHVPSIPQRQPSRLAQRYRTRGNQRRSRPTAADPWTSVWRSVWERLHFDLDFPFAQDDEEDAERQAEAQRREFREYQRRYQIAERQGGARRFQAIQATLMPTNNSSREEEPEEESQEEIQAWNAFEKARELVDGSHSGNRKKRKSVTTSPVEPPQEPQRKFKRPRTTKAQDSTNVPSRPAAESSSTASNRASGSMTRPQTLGIESERTSGGPTFIQSLLNEVQSSNAPNEQRSGAGSPLPMSDSHHSPRMSSPDVSPSPSTHGTPRPGSATPPPLEAVRPNSPTPLTSSMLPVFPTAPEYSPSSPVIDAVDEGRRTRSGVRDYRTNGNSDSSPTRSKDASPSRTNLPFSIKQEIQKMVSSILKPRYRNQELNRDQYTDINRDISRMLYDKVGDAKGLSGQKDKEHWQRIAAEEVDTALKALNVGVVNVAAS
ncbi:MAG: hypothetical protein M1820_004769 [Bogoriella megaspora]|nr:MAG: hypothetical protein M1820_004769 [Bogoriella megaspora]